LTPIRLSLAAASIFASSALLASATGAVARDLSFEDRVRAQEAIERVYYSHQIGATKPFEQAVPRVILERKVQSYLRESAALKTIWQTPITAEMLRAEQERMSRRSRMPERLLEIRSALGGDSFLFQECYVRAILADRLAHNFFGHDKRIHGDSSRKAQELHDSLTGGSAASLRKTRVGRSWTSCCPVTGERARAWGVTGREVRAACLTV
jgi:hypothetical protein